jgi:hypothetical protein
VNIFQDNWKRYFDLGLIPYPADRKIKGTYIKWEKDFPPERVTEKTCEEWARKFPNHNIWVMIGGHAVIDPDGPGSEDFIRSLNLPPCPTSISGNKSIHRWFKISSQIKPIKATNGNDETFLELRTGRMGMLAVPSIHPETGKEYKWEPGHSPWEIPFPELPAEAYRKILALTQKTDPKMEAADPSLDGKLDLPKYLSHYGIKFKVKPDGTRVIYALEKCVFSDSHTVKDSRGDSSIIQGPDGKLGYHCFHNHCSLRTWRDARQAISGEAKLDEFLRGYRAPKEEKPIVSLKQAVLDADQLRVMDFPEKKKILSPWLSEQCLVLVSGWRGAGKTWFALGVADAITRGEGFGQWQTMTPCPCLYIDGEMAIQDTKERIDALAAATAKKRLAPLLVYSDFYGNSLGLPKANLINHKWRKAILELSLDWSVKLIVLDNLASLCPKIDENSGQEWSPVNQWLLECRFNGISAIALHHTNKEGGQRGTSAREDNLDISISLVQPHDYVAEDGCRFILKFSKARIRTADLALIADTEFQLKETDGRLAWTFSGLKKKNKVEVLRAFSEKIPQKDIPAVMGISKGQVSKIRAWLIEEDYLTDGGEITVKGTNWIRGN